MSNNVPKMQNPPPPPELFRAAFKVVKITTGEPATVAELNKLINQDNQLFFSWVSVPENHEKGIVNVNIDSVYDTVYKLVPKQPKKPTPPPNRIVYHNRLFKGSIGPVERVIWFLIAAYLFVLLFIINL